MTILYQTSEKNPTFNTKGNGKFGNITITGWIPSRLGEVKKEIILKYLNDSNVQEVYKRGKKIYCLFLNGIEKEI